MNLKTAARLLGVHYQTAYRYVRAGDLVAVKVGAGYEVSEAAIARFQARRQALVADAPAATHARRTPISSLDEVRLELDELLVATTLSTKPVFDVVARWLAEEVQAGCVLWLLSEDGQWMVPMSWHHSLPGARARLSAMLTSTLRSVAEAPERPAVQEGRLLRVDHHPADVARRILPAPFQQYGREMVTHAFVAAPVLSPRGLVRGVLTVSTNEPGRPLPAEVDAWATELASFVAAAIERVDRFRAGWVARQTLHGSVEALLAVQPATDPDELTDVLMDLLDDEVPEAVLTPERELVVANEAFCTRFGLDTSAPSGEVVSRVLVDCGMASDDEVWDRLVSGETDFLDELQHGCTARCPVSSGIHWAVARRPDATPVFVIAACDVDAGAVGEVQGECWGLCHTESSAAMQIRRAARD